MLQRGSLRIDGFSQPFAGQMHCPTTGQYVFGWVAYQDLIAWRADWGTIGTSYSPGRSRPASTSRQLRSGFSSSTTFSRGVPNMPVPPVPLGWWGANPVTSRRQSDGG